MIEFLISDGPNASVEDVEVFVDVVGMGGAVVEHFVRSGIVREGTKIVFAKSNGTTVGVAALKVPLEEYRTGLESEAKSGHFLPKDAYPFELGYVAVSPDHGGKGIGTGLVEKVVTLANA